MKILGVIFFTWYMLLRVFEIDVRVGPYDSYESCAEALSAIEAKLEELNLELANGECVWMVVS